MRAPVDVITDVFTGTVPRPRRHAELLIDELAAAERVEGLHHVGDTARGHPR